MSTTLDRIAAIAATLIGCNTDGSCKTCRHEAVALAKEMAKLLPLLREVEAARTAIDSLDMSRGHVPGLGAAADRAGQAGDALIRHLRGDGQ
jgi:hypothetical protein